MGLSQVSLIIVTDEKGGFAKDGIQPFESSAVSQYRSSRLFGNIKNQKNHVIMGRSTYESPGPFEGLVNVVISKKLKQKDHQDVNIFPSIGDALLFLGARKTEVFVLGGQQILMQFLTTWIYLVKEIVHISFTKDYKCDLTIPLDLIRCHEIVSSHSTPHWKRIIYGPQVVHPESSYLQILQETRESSKKAISPSLPVFNVSTCGRLVFDLKSQANGIRKLPIFTSRYLDYSAVVKLAIESLQDYSEIVETLRIDPLSHIHVRNDSQKSVQFIVNNSFLTVVAMVYRCDFLEDLPSLVTQLSLISICIASITGLSPAQLYFCWGEGLLAESQNLTTFLSRTPYPFPDLQIRNISKIKEITDFTPDKIQIDDYQSWPMITLHGR